MSPCVDNRFGTIELEPDSGEPPSPTTLEPQHLRLQLEDYKKRHTQKFNSERTTTKGCKLTKDSMTASNKRKRSQKRNSNPATKTVSEPKTSSETKESYRESDSGCIIIIGDSIIKELKGNRLKRKAGVNAVYVQSYSGAHAEDIAGHVKPAIRRKPKMMVIHAGTNDIQKKSSRQVAESLVNIGHSINRELPETQVVFSEIIKRDAESGLNQKIASANKILKRFCTERGWGWISNDNIDQRGLNGSGLHLNNAGTGRLASNMLDFFVSSIN